MDLTQFEGLSSSFEDGVEVDILHPVTSKPTGLKVRVASYQSERVKARVRRMANQARLEQKRNPRKIETVEQTEQRTVDVLVASVISWSGFERGGKKLECTEQNVRDVLSDPDLWFITEQIDRVADDQEAFIKA